MAEAVLLLQHRADLIVLGRHLDPRRNRSLRIDMIVWRANECNVRVALEKRNLPCEPLGSGHIIGIHARDIFAPAQRQAGIQCFRQTPVLRVPVDGGPRILHLPQNLRRAVGAAVINDDHFEILVRLIIYARQGLTHEALPVVNGQENADLRANRPIVRARGVRNPGIPAGAVIAPSPFVVAGQVHQPSVVDVFVRLAVEDLLIEPAVRDAYEDIGPDHRRTDSLNEFPGGGQIGRRLARHTDHHTGGRLDAEFMAPAKRILNLLDGDTLFHEVEHALRAAFDAEVEAVRPCPHHELHQLPRERRDPRLTDPGNANLPLDHQRAEPPQPRLVQREVVLAEINASGAVMTNHMLDVRDDPLGAEARVAFAPDRADRAERAFERAAPAGVHREYRLLLEKAGVPVIG